jgi:hypothetical protein
MANKGIEATGWTPPINAATLPKPLGDLGSLDDRLSQISLMGDDQRRYKQKSAESAVALPKDRIEALLARFSPRLKVLPFTSSGIPTDEETSLTKDLWAALSESERKNLIENTARMVAENRGTPIKSLPDQEPYAMRLLHRSMRMKAKED